MNRRRELVDALGGVTQFQYDAVGNLAFETDPLGRVTEHRYNGVDRRTKTIDAAGGETLFTHNVAGNLTDVTDANGNVTQFSYDVLNRRVQMLDAEGGLTEYAYDPLGNLLEETNPLGHVTAFGYDQLGRPTSVTDPLGNTTLTTYDAVGNTLSVTDPLGHATTFQYDELHRLVIATDQLGGVTAYTYDALGNRTSLTDPVSNTTVWTYDGLDRMTTETNELGNARLFVYDAVGNLVERTDRNGRAIAYQFDDLNRTTHERWLDGAGAAIRTLEFTYDAASQLLSAFDPAGTFVFQYDALGRITSEVQTLAGLGFDIELTQQFDPLGNRTQLAATLGTTADFINDYAYDALNRMTEITRQGVTGGSSVAPIHIALSYDAASQFESIRRYADLAATQLVVETGYTFDDAGRLTGLAHQQGATALAGYIWTYDAANRITEFDSLLDGTATYAYDDTDQLTGATYSYQTDEAHLYDANGNRTRRTHIATGTVTEYEWDHRNRLVKVTELLSLTGPVTKIVEYGYDAFNRRVLKLIDFDADGTPEEQVFLVNDGLRASRDNAGDHLVLALDAAGQVTNRYLHGPAVDQILADEQIDPSTGDSEVIWPLGDNLNTIRDLAIQDEALGITDIANHRTYDAFGNMTSETDSAVDHIFTFTGRELDAETGLHNYRARPYDALLGQFIGEDPIGFDAQDPNLRRYVKNAPTNATDPSGLEIAWLKQTSEWINSTLSGMTSSVGSSLRDLAYSSTTTVREYEEGKAKRAKTNFMDHVATHRDIFGTAPTALTERQAVRADQLNAKYFEQRPADVQAQEEFTRVFRQHVGRKAGHAITATTGAVEAGAGVVLIVPTGGLSTYLIVDGGYRYLEGMDGLADHAIRDRVNALSGANLEHLNLLRAGYEKGSEYAFGTAVPGQIAYEVVPIAIIGYVHFAQMKPPGNATGTVQAKASQSPAGVLVVEDSGGAFVILVDEGIAGSQGALVTRTYAAAGLSTEGTMVISTATGRSTYVIRTTTLSLDEMASGRVAGLSVSPHAPKGGGKQLLPGEGAVGTYDDLIAAGSKGDNITPHHIPSANHMKQHGVSKGDGISINMEHPHPGSGGRHRQTFTYGTRADQALSPRDALGRGVRDTKRIYEQEGLYGPDIRRELQDLIEQNRTAKPGLFD